METKTAIRTMKPRTAIRMVSWQTAAAALLLVVFVCMGIASAIRASVTFDEFAHVPAGVAYWRQQSFTIYPHNPPLARLISTLPILADCRLPAIDAEAARDPEYRWRFAEDFMFANLTPAGDAETTTPGTRYDRMIFRCRMAILLLGALLGIIVYGWSRSLYGDAGALISLALYCLSPTVLAHASLATTDVATAFFATLTLYAHIQWSQSNRFYWLIIAAIALGAALLTKFTNGLLLVPVFLIIGLQAMSQQNVSQAIRLGRLLKNCAAVVLIAYLVFCSGYLFSDMLRPLGGQVFHAPLFTTFQGVLPAWLPIPLPYAAIMGIDSELARAHYRLGIFYLNGELSHTGWYAYFPIAVATKVPIPVLMMWSVAAITAVGHFRHPEHWPAGVALFLTPLLFLSSFILMTSTNYGIRYLLPCFPLLFVLSGAVWRAFNKRWARYGIIVLLTWHAAGTLRSGPFYLAYFNEVAGGSQGGMRILADSNLDWGQQLKELKRYMDQHHIEEIALSYSGPIDPRTYGIRWRPYRMGQTLGPAAVSANHLVGYFPMGGIFGAGKQDLKPLLRRPPEAVIANAMYVYNQ